jgi:hypothetical protein
MSANAATWFYEAPEPNAYLISERLNGNFWQSRIVSIYWRCVQAEAPYRAEGHMGNTVLELSWEPNVWLALTVPADLDVDALVSHISDRVLKFPASFTYETPDGERVYEWWVEDAHTRWSEIQGTAGFINPTRLAAQRSR